MANPRKAPKPRSGTSNYRADLVIAGKESFLCFDDHYEDLFNRIVEALLNLANRDRIQSVKIYRWNGVADAGLWVHSTTKPMSAFRKRLEELEAKLP